MRCADAGYIPRAFPIVAGTTRDRVMIIARRPGSVEVTTGLPFSGRAGAELRRWLARAGIDEDHLPYRTSITKCFPSRAPRGDGDRKPSPAEIARCAPWLERELALVHPTVVLLLGQLAIAQRWGRVPSGASRWLNDPEHCALLERALRLLRRAAADARAGRSPT